MAERLEIQIDVGRAKANLDALNASITKLGSTLQGLQTRGAGAFQKLTAEINNLRGVDAAAAPLRNIATSIQQVSAASQGINVSALERLRTTVNGVNGAQFQQLAVSMNTASNATSGLAAATQRAASTFSNVSASANSAANSTRNLGTAAQQASAATSSTAANISRMASASSQVAGSTNSAAAAITKFGGAANSAASSTQQFGKRIRETADAAGQATNKLGGFAGAAQKAAMSGQQLVASFRTAGQTMRNTANSAGAVRTALGSVAGGLSAATGQFGTFGIAAQNAVMAMQSLRDAGFPPGIAVGAAAATAAMIAFSVAVVGTVREIIRLNNVVTSFRNTVDGLRGAGSGAAALKDLQGIATRTATDIESLAKNYQRFAAAAAQSNMQVGETNAIFEKISGAARILNLDATKTERVFNALTQIVSKSKVQMEELRQQLGDSLPGAFDAMAKAANTSTENLAKMIEQGQVGSDVLPAFAAEIFNAVGGLSALDKALLTLQAQTVQFTNNFKNLALLFGEGFNLGFMDTLAQGMAMLNRALQQPGVEMLAQALGDLAGLVGGVLLTSLTALVNVLNGVGMVFNTITGVITGAISVVERMINGFGEMIGVTNLFGSSVEMVIGVVGSFVGIMVSLRAALAITALITGLTGAMGGLAVAIKGVGAALAFITGPAGAVVAGLTAVIAVASQFSVVQNAFRSAKDAFIALATGVQDSTAAFQKNSEVIKGLGFSYNDLKKQLSGVASSASEQAEAINLAREGMLGTKEATMQYAEELSNLQQQQRNAANEAQEFNNRIAKVREQQQSTARSMQNSINNLEKLKQKYGDVGGFANSYTARIKDQKEALDRYKQSSASTIANLNRQKQSFADNRTSIQAQINAVRAAQAAIKEFGAALTSSEMAIARQAKAFGASKQEAVLLAQSMTVARSSAADLAAGVAKSNTQLEKQRQFFASNLQVINEQIKALRKQREQQGFLNAVDNARLSVLQKASEAARKRVASTNLQIAANKAFVLSQQQNIKSSDALKQVWDQLNSEARENIGSFDEFKKKVADKAAADVKAAQSGEKLASATDRAATSAEKAASKLGKIIENTKTMAIDAPVAATGVRKITSALDRAGPAAATGAEAFKMTADAMQRLATSTGTVAGQFTTLNMAITNLNPQLEPLTTGLMPVITVMERLSEQMITVSDGFLKMAQSLPVVSQSLLAMQQTLPPFVEAMAQLSVTLQRFAGAADAIKQVTSAVEAALPKLTNMAKLFVNIGEEVKKGSDAMTKQFVPGFQNGSSAAASSVRAMVDSMISDLNSLIRKINEAIRRLEELERARAQASSSGSESGESARLGGIIGQSTIGRQTVPEGTFNNAPRLASGIANTNRLMRKLPGSGIPAVLHPNEAVVPLPQGRSIPVEFRGVQNDESFTKMAMAISDMGKSMNALGANLTERKPVKEPTQPLSFADTDAMSRFTRQFGPASRSIEERAPDTRDGGVQISYNITTPDADSFRRSQPQIEADAFRRGREANRRNR